MPKSFKQEIFSVGKWNGLEFTLADLKLMAASFHQLNNAVKVPLKLGHNDEQGITDGQPALGWVTDMFVDQSSTPPKLVAEFSDVPDVLFEAMKKRLYTSVSIELDFDVQYKGEVYSMVVTAVAILGADAPAVNVLNDLTEYMSRAPKIPSLPFTCARQATFKADTLTNKSFNIGGSGNMPTVEELQAKLDAEKAKTKALQTEKETSDANFKKLKADNEAKEKQEREASIKAKREEVTSLFEKAVTDKKITPAKRESFSKLLNLDNDDAVLALDVESVKSLLGEEKKKDVHFNKEESHSEGDGSDLVPEGVAIDAHMRTLTRQYMSKHNVKSYAEASEQVMLGNPELAKAYFAANGVKGGDD